MLYYRQEDNGPQGGLPEKKSRKATPLPIKCSDPKKLDFYYAAEFRICCVFFMQQN